MQAVAARQQSAQRHPFRPWAVHHCFRQRRRHECQADFLVREPLNQLAWIQACLFIRNMDTRAGRQIRPQFPHRRVKRQAGQLRGPILGAHLVLLLVPTDQVQHPLMLDLDSLGCSCGTGRVNHVGEIFRGCHIGGVARIGR